MGGMLERVEHDNGVVTYQSPILRATGVAHAFSTRLGGLSAPPFDTLNLGLLAKGADHGENTNVAENFRRLRRAIGVERVPRFEVRQVHGSVVWTAPEKPVHPREVPCADAIVTGRPGQLLTVRTADCVPILLASRDGRVVAAIHAGWRGVVAGVVKQALFVLHAEYKLIGSDLVAAIGPAISRRHFEVDADVARQFAAAGLMDATVEGGPKPHVDLPAAVHAQLRAADVPMDAIDHTDRCTYAAEDEFFSHRRDVTHRGLAATGRMAAVIATAGAGSEARQAA